MITRGDILGAITASACNMPCCGRQPFLHLSHEIPDRRNISLRPEPRVRSGLAYDSEESWPGLVCVASPVRGPGGQVAGALSVSGWSARMKPDRVGPAVPTATLTISRALGARAVPWTWAHPQLMNTVLCLHW